MYSIVARINWLMQWKNIRKMAACCFGSAAGIMTKDLTPRLGNLHEFVDPGSDPVAFVRKHTLLPFYAPFWSPQRLSVIENRLNTGNSFGNHSHAGMQVADIQRPKYLRFCPRCAEAEREKTGEAYWHRLHQVPGVMVCPDHMVFLEASGVEMSSRICHRLYAAEEAIEPEPSVALDPVDPDHQTLVRIARSAEWLLQKVQGANDVETLRQRYLALASEHGYLTVAGCVRMKKLLHDFRSRYSPKLLEMLDSKPEVVGGSWLRSLFQKSGGGTHPSRHLLLLDFFNTSPDIFFNLGRVPGILGPGPWACTNRLCPQAGKEAISTVRYVKNYESQRVVGILACPTCGQEVRITRVNGHNRTRIGKRGHLWELELSKLWRNTDLSLRQVAVRLDASVCVVVRNAVRLGLPYPRMGNGRVGASDGARYISMQKTRALKKLEKRKAEWVQLREKFPDLTVMELRRKAESCYAYLIRRDRHWLSKHRPARNGRWHGHKRVDWDQCDRQLVIDLRLARCKILTQTGPPVRVTKKALMDCVSIDRLNMRPLPLARAALDSLAEGRLSFVQRAIAWMAVEFRKERGVMDAKEFKRRVCRRFHDLQRNPIVLGAIGAEISENDAQTKPDLKLAA